MKKIVFLIIILLTTGCYGKLGDFSILSNKDIALEDIAKFEKGPFVTGEDSSDIIVFIPIGVSEIRTALNNALASIPGAVALVNASISYGFWYIPYIYGKDYYIVEGQVLIDPQKKDADNKE